MSATKLTQCLAVALMLLLGTAAQAEDSTGVIRVSGQGEVSLPPDMAIVDLTVVREGDDAGSALEQNSRAMSDVLAAMRKAGIEERDLQTSNFGIQPRYVYPERRQGEDTAPRIVGYSVRNSLQVRIRDMALVGTILDTAIRMGVNDGGQLRLGNQDPGAALEQARKAAVADALAKAGTLAEAAGVTTGKIISLDEQTRSYRPSPMMMRAEGAMAKADAVPIAGGENSYQVDVQLSIAIEE